MTSTRLIAVLLLVAGCGGEQEGAAPDTDLAAIAGPTRPAELRPVERVPRDRFGVVSPPPLGGADLDAFIFPGADEEERASVREGLTFFTTVHTAAEGLGPVANQTRCLGCHWNAAEAIPGLVNTPSHVARAGRATPTNFAFTALDPATGGGRAAESLDALAGTGATAAFTIFGDFAPATGAFDGLTDFSGFVQHTRPSVPACLADPILPVDQDRNLAGTVDPETGLAPGGQRRAVGERAGPPYIGRGLMEAVPAEAILALEDPDDRAGDQSSLDGGRFPECPGDCISGRHNENTSNQAFIGGEAVPRIGRFGLRAAGPTILQFVVGGINGELGFTTRFTPNEPQSHVNAGRAQCQDVRPAPQIPASTALGCRQLIRLTAPPELGDPLLRVLADPEATPPPGSPEARVKRGAQLFGVDVTAFANRMIPGRMPAGGDGRDDHAVDQRDRGVGCASCHTPIQATGQSPALVGGRHLSQVWAPLFTDLLLHEGPEVTPERLASLPRNPVLVARAGTSTFDLSRNLADDALPNQGLASGREFRTSPLMGLGRIGPPFLHDGRVFLSARTVADRPAGTVYSDATVTNAPLVVRTLPDALRAAVELHDLPAPDDARTPGDGGCPLPAGGGVTYRGPDDVCPAYDAVTSRRNRGEARLVMKRYRALAPADQEALLAFLQQL
jgi:hypothetical protein